MNAGTDHPALRQRGFQVLLSMILGLIRVLLPRHIERNLGMSLRSDDGLHGWTAAEYEFPTHGSLSAAPEPPTKERVR
ncbi:MAG: hypothetical protein F2681_08095 [Actinobacteria bacterium]|uniref:Unannotated protein n=1 Tax=freshwater metagenome TaxID=449393 RepID=A0A6J6A548_9ZZZZ|nr:hypothetical protein [Actinomycetota bacterium]MSW77742.1 hypothetical protein [Actinomycetota bacterium]MSX93171.1 hypothetical protein [Actinomycetota bacterium]MSZ83087.1 hypothetical protein [Actinomycetota bacterium]MTB18116.1 hypothetical protein [Actinomycetota bacterium]